MAGMIALTEAVAIGKIGKIWVNNVRRDIPKHQRNFTTFHRKQLVDAKRSAENCQREVRLKVSRSIKWMHTAGIRTQKLASDMLLFWKRIDKEMTAAIWRVSCNALSSNYDELRTLLVTTAARKVEMEKLCIDEML
ncbi:DNA helicase [Arachis hypogaea]|nr:DNA helicase [Arachis hypogaea]